ncbi:MAG: glycosyltransferase family 4 protein, partial [Segetibacter sp.]|nr:glycosyltransferase family 4 protein [Segetibacter sp.]
LHKLRLPIWHRWRLVAAGPISSEMKEYLMHTNADAICGSASNYYYMQLPLWRKCNFFYFGSIHLSEDEGKPVLNETQRKCIQASTLYLANTQFEKRRLVKAGIPADKIKVLGVGVEEKFFEITAEEKQAFRKSLSIPQHGIVVGYAGRIERTKSVKLLLESFATIAATNPNVYLLMAGSGSDYIKELQDFSLQLGKEISDRIKWKANFEMKEKAAIFHNMDVLVLPSSNESFGIVFLEAWICKKPVIGAAIGAVRDVINENEDGLLMEINSSNSLTEQLIKLINNKALRTALGESGYNKVVANYTWDIITKRLREYYLSSVNTSNIKLTTNV